MLILRELIGLLPSPGAGVNLDADATNQRDATHAQAMVWRRPDEAQSQGLPVLHDRGEMELVTRSRQASKPQPLGFSSARSASQPGPLVA